VESQAQVHKERYAEARMDASELKKSNVQYQMIIRRYKGLVSELQEKIKDLQKGMGPR
jgi:hypothetical protein